MEEACQELVLSQAQIQEVYSSLLAQINLGLGRVTNQRATVKCFPTYVKELPNGHGKFNVPHAVPQYRNTAPPHMDAVPQFMDTITYCAAKQKCSATIHTEMILCTPQYRDDVSQYNNDATAEIAPHYNGAFLSNRPYRRAMCRTTVRISIPRITYGLLSCFLFSGTAAG